MDKEKLKSKLKGVLEQSEKTFSIIFTESRRSPYSETKEFLAYLCFLCLKVEVFLVEIGGRISDEELYNYHQCQDEESKQKVIEKMKKFING